MTVAIPLRSFIWYGKKGPLRTAPLLAHRFDGPKRDYRSLQQCEMRKTRVLVAVIVNLLPIVEFAFTLCIIPSVWLLTVNSVLFIELLVFKRIQHNFKIEIRDILKFPFDL